MNNNAEARVQSDSSVPAEEVAGRLLIRRRVSRTGRSDLAVLQLPPQPAGAAANAGGSGEEGNGKAGDGSNRPAGGWRAVTPDALGDLLAPFGLQTEAVDRFVVTQHRQAVQVAEPAALARFLELLIGTAALGEQLAELEREAAAQASAYDEEEERVAKLELQRQRLAPEVARWRRYEEEHLRYGRRKVEVMSQHAALLERQLSSQQSEVSATQQRLNDLTAEQASAKQAADALLESKTAVAGQLRAADKGHARLAKLAAAAQLQAAKLEVQLKAAEAAAAAGSGAGGKGQSLEKRARQAEPEVSRCREALQAATLVLTELKAEEAAAEQKVRQLRTDVTAAPGSLTAELATAQQAADAARSAHAASRQWHEQHAARTSALEAELAAVLAAAAAQHERQQEAARQVQQLRKQLQESAPLAVEAQARLQAAQQGHVAMLAAAQEAQAALAAAESELEDLESQLAGPQRAEHGHRDTAGSAAPRRQTPDQAVAALAAFSSPGMFHGRLRSVLRLAPQGPSQGQSGGPGSIAIAVSAALLELCNPSSLLVVADRSTAQLAVSHFERHRVGIATCKILCELPAGPAGPGGAAASTAMSAAAGALPAGADVLSPLTACVVANPGVPGAASLASHLFHDWWLAADRHAAVVAVQADRLRGGRRRSIVTLQGEVFKADGEIVGARPPPPHLQPYLLTTAFTPAGQTGAAAGPAGAAAAAAAAQRTAADRLRLQQEAAALREQAQQAQQAVQQAEQECEAAAAAAGELEQRKAAAATQLAATERSLQQLQGRAGGRRRRGGTECLPAQLLEHQLAAARQEAASAETAADAAERELRLAMQRIGAARSEYEAATRGSSSGAALLQAEQGLELLQQQAAEAAAAAGAAEDALATATRQQQKLEAARQAAQAAAAEAERLRCQLEELQSKAADQQSEAAQLAEAKQQFGAECSRLDSEWRAAVKKHESVTRHCQQHQVSLRELRAAQAQTRQQLAGVRAALAEAGPAEAAGEAAPAAICQDAGQLGDAVVLQRQQSEASLGGSGPGSAEERPARQRRRPGRPGSLASLLLPARSAAVGASTKRASPAAPVRAGPTKPSRSKRRLVESSSSEPGSDAEGQGVGGLAASCSTAGAAGSSKRVAPSARQHSSGGATLSAACGRTAVRKGSKHERYAEADSDSDFESAPSSRQARSATAAAASAQRGQPRRGRGRRGASVAADATAREQSWGEEEVWAALDDLADQERRLQALRSSLSEDALQQDAAAAAQLEAAGRRLDSLADSLAQLEGRRGSLQEERYARFHSALQSVNKQLAGIYSRLTGGQGDAYCSYTQDKLAAFADGVVFHVRPDRQRWRPFAALSGGQQALVTLALCFALQAAAPSPFYFFDEIDCALDTVNAARVAEYIVSQQAQHGQRAQRVHAPGQPSGAQFLVVSHKPQVYERAGCLVGVTSRQQASEAITVHLAAFDREA